MHGKENALGLERGIWKKESRERLTEIPKKPRRRGDSPPLLVGTHVPMAVGVGVSCVHGEGVTLSSGANREQENLLGTMESNSWHGLSPAILRFLGLDR